MTDFTELKRLAENSLGDWYESGELRYEDRSGYTCGLHHDDEYFIAAANPAAVLAMISEIERLNGLQPSIPPRPPEGDGLPRFGLRWNGPSNPLAVSMDDGYWTPWHLADQLKAENEALKHSVAAGAAREWDLRNQVRSAKESRARVVKSNQALRKDADRFRYLMFNHVDWARNGRDDDAVVLEFGPYPSHKLRETIDAAADKSK